MNKKAEYEKELARKISKYLWDQFEEWQTKQPPGLSNRTLTKFASFLGIQVGTLSHYMHETRNPRSHAVIYQIASVLGPELFELAGMPPGMPDDPEVVRIVLLWMNPATTDEQRAKALDALERDPEVVK